MARVLVVTNGFVGHVYPYLSVVDWLIKSGHHVGWLFYNHALASVEPKLTAMGVEVMIPAGLETDPAKINAAAYPFVRGLQTDLEGSVAHLAALLERAPKAVERLSGQMGAFEPDVICLDGLSIVAHVATHLQNVPYAFNFPSLAPASPALDIHEIRFLHRTAPLRAKFAAAFGLSLELCTYGEALSPWINTIYTTTCLVGEDCSLPARTVLVGPSISFAHRDEPAFPWERITRGRPVIYASFGSMLEERALLDLVARATEGLDLQLVLAVGSLMDSDFPARLREDIVAVRFAPQLRLLDTAALLISHGGANSVMEAMYYGVPVLQIPLTTDQPVGAHFLHKSGAGISFRSDSIHEAEFRDAICRMIEPGNPYRASALRVRESYRAHDGAREAARRISNLLTASPS